MGAAHRVPLGGLIPRVSSPATCWRRRLRAAGARRDPGEHWRSAFTLLDEQEKRQWARAFLDDNFVPAKRGSAVGKTKRGKGTKLVLVADGNGLPVGFHLESANRHEVKLTVPTLETRCGSPADEGAGRSSVLKRVGSRQGPRQKAL